MASSSTSYMCPRPSVCGSYARHEYERRDDSRQRVACLRRNLFDAQTLALVGGRSLILKKAAPLSSSQGSRREGEFRGRSRRVHVAGGDLVRFGVSGATWDTVPGPLACTVVTLIGTKKNKQLASSKQQRTSTVDAFRTWLGT
jgi:hypothetical protein